MTKKEIILNKLYNIYNKISQNPKYTLALNNNFEITEELLTIDYLEYSVNNCINYYIED